MITKLILLCTPGRLKATGVANVTGSPELAAIEACRLFLYACNLLFNMF